MSPHPLINGRSLSEATLHANEALLRAVLDASSDGILTVSHDRTILSANRASARMFRCGADQVVGAATSTFLDLPASELPAPGTSFALVGRRIDGTTIPLEGELAPLVAEEGSFICWLRAGDERRLLESRLLGMCEQLQHKIGQDLHDGLGQLLTGTAFLAKGLETAVIDVYQPQARRVVELVNLAIARVRSLSRGLSPLHIEAQSIEAVLRDVVAESSTLLGVDCRLEIAAPVETHRPAVVTNLGFIVREAITNAVRHGHADRIVVNLWREDQRPHMSIADNGRGISDRPTPDHGLGLRIMRHRATSIGGGLTITGAASGTVVHCWWT
jgi:two-component system sensor kinase FixL